MRWRDRVYGDVSIEDPKILGLIECPTFQRLKGVRQAGPSALAFPFKTVTRFEHSLGVFLLLRRLGADRREQIAGLLHDISHTAFSHAVDFIFASREQDHHERLKPLMLERPDLVAALSKLGHGPREFYDDSIYPLLEQPLPAICADRLDYFLRDGSACGAVSAEAAQRILDHVEVLDHVRHGVPSDATVKEGLRCAGGRERRIVFNDVDVAREAARLFEVMNRDWWASPTEAFIYNEFAAVLREGMRLGVLTEDDLMTEDDQVLAKLDAAPVPEVQQALSSIRNFRPEMLAGYRPEIVPKQRWLDPLVHSRQWWMAPLSTVDGRAVPVAPTPVKRPRDRRRGRVRPPDQDREV